MGNKITIQTHERELDEFVRREVFQNVSMLVSELAKNKKYMDELYPILSQDDWISPAEEDGATICEKEGLYNCSKGDSLSFLRIIYLTDWTSNANGAAQEYCEAHNLDPHIDEAYEHWIVSDNLARELEERGEMVNPDFYNLTIWGRSCSGQAISCDSVIIDIYQSLVNETGLNLTTG